MSTKNAIIVFLDGVGLGDADPEVNPFMHVEMESMQALLGVSQLTHEAIGTATDEAVLLGTDALLGVPGLPQSATGQTTILTGHNAAALLNEHYGPYPNQPLRNLLTTDTLFTTLIGDSHRAAYANAYPDRFLDRLNRGKGRLSANTFAANAAGLKLRSREDLLRGRALTALFSNDFWPEPDVNLPPLNAYQGGVQLASLAKDYTLTFFEFWYSDLVGHRMQRDEAIKTLRMLDDFLRGILDEINLENTLLMVISDHGNFENWTTKKHTVNPSLTILANRSAGQLASRLHSLVDVRQVVLSHLFRNDKEIN